MPITSVEGSGTGETESDTDDPRLIVAYVALSYPVGMSNPSETNPPQPSGTPTTLIFVIAGACILVLGACLLCIGGGLALPIMRQKAAVEAERAALEARDAAMEAQRAAYEQAKKEQETRQRELESVRELKE